MLSEQFPAHHCSWNIPSLLVSPTLVAKFFKKLLVRNIYWHYWSPVPTITFSYSLHILLLDGFTLYNVAVGNNTEGTEHQRERGLPGHSSSLAELSLGLSLLWPISCKLTMPSTSRSVKSTQNSSAPLSLDGHIEINSPSLILFFALETIPLKDSLPIYISLCRWPTVYSK